MGSTDGGEKDFLRVEIAKVDNSAAIDAGTCQFGVELSEERELYINAQQRQLFDSTLALTTLKVNSNQMLPQFLMKELGFKSVLKNNFILTKGNYSNAVLLSEDPC